MLLGILAGASPAMAEKPLLEISGAEGALLDNLQVSLPLASETCTAPAWRIKQQFRRSPATIEKAARALGYYHLKIEKKLSFNESCWQASFQIDPGEPVLLESVNIQISGEAGEDPTFKKILTQNQIRIGRQLHHGEYENLKRQIETAAAEKGYFDGKFIQAIVKVDKKTNKAFISLQYDSGKRYRIGQLDIQQQVYNDKLLERYLNVKSGDYYDASALTKLYKNLSDSGYFQQVAIKQDFKNAADSNIDVQVQLEPRKRTAYSVGIGAATDTGPRLKASLERRRVNRRGHRFNSELMVSEVDSSIGLEYIIPTHYPHVQQVSLRTSYQETDTDTSESDITKIGFRTLGSRNKWTESIYLDWVSENSRINDEYVSADLLVPGISWTRTKADNRLKPRKGYRASLEVRGADESLFSDASFIQVLAAAKWIQPLGKGRLLLRADTGFSLTDDFSELPASYRFYAGGDQSVRGYEYQSLGPSSADGDVDGGEYLVTGSVEYDHPIVNNWSAAVFWDAGNAFDDWNVDFKQSAGLGLRWQSPIGPIRLDLAIPDDTSKDDYRLHFSMGADL